VWRWKDIIDRRFMDKFAALPAMAASAQDGETDADMRCGGCAAKLGPVVLQGALDRLDANAHRMPGPRDDAAIIDDGGDTLRLETADYFRAFWPEPYVFGAIAAEHALSDIYAMGGMPERALAIAVLPYAGSRQSADDLFQLMAGARATFDRAGVALVGGHSSEGAELGAGFFVSGAVPRNRVLRKSGLRVGDALILTKPLGTGILFAGWMRRLARARDITAALDGMRASNGNAARILSAQNVSAMTDVTGFGLAGHLLELLEASGAGAVIVLDRCQRYSGVDELIGQGVRSTLLPQNLALAGRIGGKRATDAALALLLDPQTSGGLLMGIEASQAEGIVAQLKRAGVEAAIVGHVVAADQFPLIRIE
jgi:selenide, water dikinase